MLVYAKYDHMSEIFPICKIVRDPFRSISSSTKPSGTMGEVVTRARAVFLERFARYSGQRLAHPFRPTAIP